MGDGFTVRVPNKLEEVKALLEVGFGYVCQKGNLIYNEETQMSDTDTRVVEVTGKVTVAVQEEANELRKKWPG